ncbi:MAG: hypothetical protein ACD_78C00089G0002 [uncultured bacterium (gcode 4)]|uniref:Uncharacterized protein n=1 Tax=uncultured bacterium (gcode 4) TaxID=1234023 RepID=K1YY43_9BACT|nr:MAG: hypothetical protein ACD_78C00089G0002 [uncultured bacterium (gcode 4)]
MNTLSGSITFRGKIDTTDIWIHFVLNEVREWVFNIFMYWDTQFESSHEVTEYIDWKITGEILSYDVSISTEDKIKIYWWEKDWKYILKSVQWKDITFEGVVNSLTEPGIVSVREAEESKVFWNRVIKIDYLV